MVLLDGLTENGAPLKWLNCPFNWKPPKMALATPWLSHIWSRPKGRW